MKHAFISTVAALSLVASLSACNVPSGNAVTVTQSIISQVQAEAKAICGVVPDALSIGALFSGNAALATVSGVVGAICGAVNSSPAVSVRRMVKGSLRTVHAPVVVDGVTVNFID